MSYSWKIYRGLTEEMMNNILVSVIVEESSVELTGIIDRIENAATFSEASEIALSQEVTDILDTSGKSFLFIYRDFDKKGILIKKE